MEDLLTESLSYKERKWIALSIAGMVGADGKIDPSELDFLRMAIKFLDNKEDINSILQIAKEGKIPPLPPLKIERNLTINILKHLTYLAIVDEELAPSEEAFLKHVAELLGVPHSIPDKLLEMARKKLEDGIIRAQFTVKGNKDDVRCLELSENSCTFDCQKPVNIYTPVELQFYQKNKLYEPIACTVNWMKKKQPNSFSVKVCYNEEIKAHHGIHQLMHPEVFVVGEKKELKSENTSLSGFYVHCRICDRGEIPFWMLRPDCIKTDTNIFGTPVYLKAVDGTNYCDYNMVRIAVCPNCLFATDILDFFQVQGEPVSPASFDIKMFSIRWKDHLLNRQKWLEGDVSSLLSENRTLEQAIATYRFAIHTHDLLARQVKTAFFHQEQALSLLMTQAELLMTNGQKIKAENNLFEVLQRLTPLLHHFQGVVKIQVMRQLAMINLYFKREKEFNKYLNLLTQQKDKGLITPKTPEYQTLFATIDSLEQVAQHNQSYWHTNRKSFRKTTTLSTETSSTS
ncbi:hypothetical protein WDW89_03055 [Deltaproteobacteria bacterium TL4]